MYIVHHTWAPAYARKWSVKANAHVDTGREDSGGAIAGHSDVLCMCEPLLVISFLGIVPQARKKLSETSLLNPNASKQCSPVVFSTTAPAREQCHEDCTLYVYSLILSHHEVNDCILQDSIQWSYCWLIARAS
jgi:hypothetical protein